MNMGEFSTYKIQFEILCETYHIENRGKCFHGVDEGNISRVLCGKLTTLLCLTIRYTKYRHKIRELMVKTNENNVIVVATLHKYSMLCSYIRVYLNQRERFRFNHIFYEQMW